MPRYKILRTRTETMESTTRAETVIDAPDARVALQLAERYSDGYEWDERDDSTSDADYEDEYELIEDLADNGAPMRGRPEDYGLAQAAMFDAVTTP